jgi:PPM family protein phosphatase
MADRARSNLVVHLCGLTDVGNHRQTNEDAWWAGQLGGSFALVEKLGETVTFRCAAGPVVAIVSDGVGGANAGEVASQMAVTCIPIFLASRRVALATAAEDAVRAALQDADAAIKTKAAQPGMGGMCATVTLLCLVDPHSAWWGQAGDSRIYRCRHGRLEQITRDHSPVGRMRQEGWITEEEARRHPQRNQIDQSLGDPLNPFHPDVASLEMQPWDVYLLCSDGLSDGLWEREIEQALARIRAATDVQPVAEHLVAAAMRTSGRDNITVVVLLVEETAATSPICRKAAGQ